MKVSNHDTARAMIDARDHGVGPGTRSDAAQIQRNLAVSSVTKQLDAGVPASAVYIPSGVGHRGSDEK